MRCKDEPVRSSTKRWEMSFPPARGFSTACQSWECQLCTWPLPGKCRHSPGAMGETSQNFWERIKSNPEAALAGVYGVCKLPHGFCTTPLASQAPPGISAPGSYPFCCSGRAQGLNNTPGFLWLCGTSSPGRQLAADLQLSVLQPASGHSKRDLLPCLSRYLHA